MQDYYSILNSEANISEGDLNARLKTHLKKSHPSKSGNNTSDDSTANYRITLEALLFLRNNNVRRKYDLLLKHKNNTEVRHSIKYKKYKEIVDKTAIVYNLQASKIAKMNAKEFKVYYKNNFFNQTSVL